MNIRQALIEQRPSLELQRSAQSEIAKLDHMLSEASSTITELTARLNLLNLLAERDRKRGSVVGL